NTDMTIEELGDPSAEIIVDDSELEILRGVIDKIGRTHFIIAHSPYGGTFPWMGTVGMEEYLIRFITDPEFCHRAAEIACRKCIAYANAYLDAGADAIMISEDYGDNKGLTMGRERYKEFIMPYLKRIVDAVHAKGGKLIKHSDGIMWDALDTFDEIGVDGWHGIQPSIGMYPERIKARYGGKFCFFGGVNVETIIAGTPDDVRREVRRMIKYAGPGGGLVMACGNILEPDTKPANIFAMQDEINRIGNYPIDVDAIMI
ncbi:MAG: uroporphyrinogen decarboxylase family protein, partial [Oscillospiraceae bacterium]